MTEHPPMNGREALCAELNRLASGEIAADAQPRVERLLADAWVDLRGTVEGGMVGYKVLGRAEGLAWDPPYLRFTIERHGGTVLGSTRAQLQHWEINVETGEAGYDEQGFRQLYPRVAVVQVEPLAEEIGATIVQGGEHPAVTYLTPTRARVQLSKIPALTGGYKQTIAGRRRRFVAALSRRLEAQGWFAAGGSYHVFERRAMDT